MRLAFGVDLDGVLVPQNPHVMRQPVTDVVKAGDAVRPGPREPIKALGKWTDYLLRRAAINAGDNIDHIIGRHRRPSQRGRVDAESLEIGGYLRGHSIAGMIAAQRIAVAVEKHRPRYD